MTAVDDRPQAQDHAQMETEDFENLASDAARRSEGLRLEFIGGKLRVHTVPDVIHTAMTMWLLRQCMQQKPQWDLSIGQGLKVESYRRGRAIPDGVLAPVGHLVETLSAFSSTRSSCSPGRMPKRPERPTPAGNGAALNSVLADHRPDEGFARDVQEVRDLLVVDRLPDAVPASGR